MAERTLPRRAARAGFDVLERLDAATGFSRLYPDESNAILAYHAVGRPAGYGNVSVERFRRDVAYVTEHFEAADLPDVLESSGGKRVAFTFDDALDDFYEHALPVLREHRIPATLFVPVDFVGGGPDGYAYRFVRSPAEHASFNDPAAFADESVPDPAVMSWDRLREVAADPLVTVGTHSRTHLDLGRVRDAETLEREIVGARDELQARLGVDVDRFCYPFGRYTEEAVEAVRASHAMAVTSRPGVVGGAGRTVTEADRYRLPRVRAHGTERRVRWDLSGLRWRLTEYIE
ncbi:xylanase/chitin deacetylase [Halogeometricum pallidum JCM 14848]|uniref:Xylanase/chitin deacetylase n=1 Tax=Halogeometricum pallidum JCM 14848 TaxID=1227487 RepID=M0DCA8_HALPD|nr:polysaccharide deacetylase family protein [Halogeometricum pallidum]ELZ31809.1 xylanase/chitin deacetylase [Halogeometricum pallidum JCM 14848]